MLISTYEASQKYTFTTRHLRHLLETEVIKGRRIKMTSMKSIWLIEEESLKQYLKMERKPGPKAKKKTS